jgi:hypothetical protein
VQIVHLGGCESNTLLQVDRSFNSCRPELKQEGVYIALLSIAVISHPVSPHQQQQQQQQESVLSAASFIPI